jgi:hypothetical protein
VIIFRVLTRGLSFAVSWPKMLGWLWLVSIVIALPAAVFMGESIRSNIGPSLVHQHLLDELDLGWLEEYRDEASGLEKSLTATAVSKAMFLDNIEAWFSGRLFEVDRVLVALGLAYILIWSLMVAGVLDHFARGPDRFQLGLFLSGGANYWFRFLRLVLISGVCYYLVYRFAQWLFPWIEEATRDVTVERTVLFWNLLGALAVVFLLALVNMIFDYAKIATVREHRRSMFLAAFRGLVFVISHRLRSFGVYYALALVAMLLPLIYLFFGPGTGQSTWTNVLLVFLVGQVYLVARLVLRLTFYGSQLALYDLIGRRRTLEFRGTG